MFSKYPYYTYRRLYYEKGSDRTRVHTLSLIHIFSNALHIVPHPERALTELRRVLKNDGMLIAPTFTHAENSPWGRLQALALKIAGFPLHSRWTSVAYLAFLQQNGWTVCKSVVLQNSIPLTYAAVSYTHLERIKLRTSLTRAAQPPVCGTWKKAIC